MCRDLKDSLNRNLFFSCVSELALESREVSHLSLLPPPPLLFDCFSLV